MKSRFCLLSVQTVLEDKLKNAKKRNATTMKKRKEKKGKEKKTEIDRSNRGSHCGTSVIQASQERRKKQRWVPRTIRILIPVS